MRSLDVNARTSAVNSPAAICAQDDKTKIEQVQVQDVRGLDVHK